MEVNHGSSTYMAYPQLVGTAKWGNGDLVGRCAVALRILFPHPRVQEALLASLCFKTLRS